MYPEEHFHRDRKYREVQGGTAKIPPGIPHKRGCSKRRH